MKHESYPTQCLDNNTMHAKPDLRVVLKWMIAGSGSVITDVIRLALNQPAIHVSS